MNNAVKKPLFPPSVRANKLNKVNAQEDKALVTQT
jgi:hypothetical protein